MLRFEKNVNTVAEWFNVVAAFMLLAMMLATMLDVVMRFFGRPVPGAYEMVGLFGCSMIALALGYTSLLRGHIAVDLAVRKLPRSAQLVVDGLNTLTAVLLFAVIARQSLLHGVALMRTGEVSLTIQIPIFPFAFCLAAGCMVLCLVLIGQFLRMLRLLRDIIVE